MTLENKKNALLNDIEKIEKEMKRLENIKREGKWTENGFQSDEAVNMEINDLYEEQTEYLDQYEEIKAREELKKEGAADDVINFLIDEFFNHDKPRGETAHMLSIFQNACILDDVYILPGSEGAAVMEIMEPELYEKLWDLNVMAFFDFEGWEDVFELNSGMKVYCTGNHTLIY